MANKKVMIAMGAALMVAGFAANAQVPAPIRPAYQFPASSPVSGAASVQMGESPVYFTPYLGFAAGHDDNLFLSNANKKGSALYITSPGFKLDARDAAKVFQMSYQGQIGRYAQSEDDDYVDHTFGTSIDMAFSPRAFARLDYAYVRSHDPRGSTDRTISTSPDKYKFSRPGATFVYGAPGSEGRVEVYYSDGQRTYLNNRATTVGSDRDTQDFGGAFYWRVMPRTYALVDVRRTDQRYVLSTSPLDSNERRIYAGLSWEATATTTGTIKVGSLRKQFNSDLPTVSTTGWEALVTWAPRTYSKFDFYSARYPTESTGLGNFILSDATGVVWTHAWNSLLTTGVNARYQRDKYEGFDRTDDIKSVGLRVGYKFRRWLTLGAEYTYTKRDSNTNVYDYDKNLYLLTATGSL